MSLSEDVKFSNVRGLYLRKYGIQTSMYLLLLMCIEDVSTEEGGGLYSNLSILPLSTQVYLLAYIHSICFSRVGVGGLYINSWIKGSKKV